MRAPRGPGQRARTARAEFGDWQTPGSLADAVLEVVHRHIGFVPATVLETTCGKGSFLAAAAHRFPSAQLRGLELNPAHAAIAQDILPSDRSSVRVGDFFQTDWQEEIRTSRKPVLVLGNPPWATSAELGAMGSSNLPPKSNFKGLSGISARTGLSNFDVSEWMLLRLIEALQGTHSAIAVLCKSSVARRLIEFSGQRHWQFSPGGLWRIETAKHFGASVDAVLLLGYVSQDSRGETSWPLYPSLDATHPDRSIGLVGTFLASNTGLFRATSHLSGQASPVWRSGIKHDCARVMELRQQNGHWQNGVGETVEIEEAFRYPLLKGSDVANGRLVPTRAVVVPQRHLGEDTQLLQVSAPQTWAYLWRHREWMQARQSSVYRGHPPFSVFGVGEYSFARWKVAVSGFHKHFEFRLVSPFEGKPVLLDDTCYFLPFADEDAADRARQALSSPIAKDFLQARTFWDAKRPIRKQLLQNLDLCALIKELEGR